METSAIVQKSSQGIEYILDLKRLQSIKDNTRTTEDYLMLRKFWPDKIARLINVLYSKGQNSNTL